MTVDSTGATFPTLDELVSRTTAGYRANVDPNLDDSVESVEGQINRTVMREVKRVYESCETLADMLNVDAAENIYLGNLGKLSGTTFRPARASTATLTLNLDDETTVFEGSLVSHEDNDSVVFRIDVDVSTELAGTVEAKATCITTGPVVAVAGKLTVIRTPQVGWNAVTNAADAKVGADAETDTAYRVRRTLELAKAGSATPSGVASDVVSLDEDAAVSVIVLENHTARVDADGLQPWTIEVVVYDGTTDGTALTDDQIAQAIYNTRAGGTRTQGSSSGEATTEKGMVKTMFFTRPTSVPLYIEADVSGTFDAELVKTQLATFAHGDPPNLEPGTNFVTLLYQAECLRVDGVTDVPAFTVGLSASPLSSDNITLSVREVGSVDTTRITITEV